MIRTHVSSSNVVSIGWAANLGEVTEVSLYTLARSTLGTLEIEFKGGRVYQYDEVPLSEYLALLSAPSKGGYVNSFIPSRYAASPV